MIGNITEGILLGILTLLTFDYPNVGVFADSTSVAITPVRILVLVLVEPRVIEASVDFVAASTALVAEPKLAHELE